MSRYIQHVPKEAPLTYKEKPLSKSALGVNVDHRINLIHFNVAEIRALFSAKRVSIRNGWIRATRMSAKEFGSKYKSSLINSTTRKSYVEMIVHALPHEFENINNTESKQIQIANSKLLEKIATRSQLTDLLHKQKRETVDIRAQRSKHGQPLGGMEDETDETAVSQKKTKSTKKKSRKPKPKSSKSHKQL